MTQFTNKCFREVSYKGKEAEYLLKKGEEKENKDSNLLQLQIT